MWMVYTGLLLPPWLSHVLLKVPNSYLVDDDFHLLVFKMSWLNVFNLTWHFFKRNIKIAYCGAISLLLIVQWLISPRELLCYYICHYLIACSSLCFSGFDILTYVLFYIRLDRPAYFTRKLTWAYRVVPCLEK
jgi:hypothetical protein